MKRSIESIQENEVVWAKSPEEAKRFCTLVKSYDRKYNNGNGYLSEDLWNVDNICYSIHDYSYCEKNYFASGGLHKNIKYIITPATEFIEDPEEEKGKEIVQEESDAQLHSNISKFSSENKDDELTIYEMIMDIHERLQTITLENIPKEVKSVPYQLCPMCHGEKIIVRNRNKEWSPENCEICNGEGIIAQKVID